VAVHFEEPDRCAEVGALRHRRIQKERGKGRADDRGQGNCKGDGEDSAIHV
jgi:hypothetical protein